MLFHRVYLSDENNVFVWRLSLYRIGLHTRHSLNLMGSGEKNIRCILFMDFELSRLYTGYSFLPVERVKLPKPWITKLNLRTWQCLIYGSYIFTLLQKLPHLNLIFLFFRRVWLIPPLQYFSSCKMVVILWFSFFSIIMFIWHRLFWRLKCQKMRKNSIWMNYWNANSTSLNLFDF